MATHKSAEKRARQSIRRTKRNTSALNAVRTFEKKVRQAIATGDKDAAQKLLLEYTSKASKAATKGVLHFKAASRSIGRLSGHVHALLAKRA